YYRQRLGRAVSGPLAPEEFFPPAGAAGGQLVLSLAPPPGSSLAAGDLGRVRLPCQDQSSALCQARLSAVRTLITQLAEPARLLADLDRSLDELPGDQLGRAVQSYQVSIEPYLEAELNESHSKLTGDLSRFKEQARTSGWLTAGACYWTITGLNRRAAQSLYQSVSFQGGQARALEGEVLSDFEAVQARYDRYLEDAFTLGRTLGTRGIPASFPSLDWFSDKISGALGRYGLDRLTSHLAQGDPITALASLGHYLIGAAETVIGLKILSMSLAQASQNSSESFLGQIISTLSGSVSSFLAGLAGGTVTALGPYLTALSLLLLGYGFFLAYFLPAVPLIFWLAGVLGWLMVVIESLAAAPLWVAAHALPEGDGLTSQASRRGYRLFLGVCLRPPLMVAGFLLAMAVLNLLGRLGGQMLTILGEEVFRESFLGISGFLALASILGITAVTAAYKLFSLTSHLPDRVGGWIGQESHHLGEPADTQQARHQFAAVTAAGTGIIKPAVEPAAKAYRPEGNPNGPHL
ncbi:MAG: DotA/TraY family protein, partial [Deltaproteobacteria bacterium]|nr:DotA/TraY family protein [Deltaproteobacteria bacterium]